LIEWFDLRHVSPASARFDLDKLRWVNHEHIKRLTDEALERELMPFLRDAGYDLSAGPVPRNVAALLRERKPTLKEIAGAAHYFYGKPADAPQMFAAVKDRPESLDQALRELNSEFDQIDWSRERISNTLKEVADKHGLAPKQFLPAVRILVTGETQTPPLDAVLALLDRAVVRQRIAAGLVQ
jgi:glutamyl-tRNA synthetase